MTRSLTSRSSTPTWSRAGAAPVDLEPFRTLPGSTATGAQQIKRLTNLMQLTVDTTWWTRYRSDNKNPDFGDTFPPAVPGLLRVSFLPFPDRTRTSRPPNHLQAIANTAALHFATIEQGGNSLYPAAGAKGDRRGGAARAAEHRADRDDALPDLAATKPATLRR